MKKILVALVLLFSIFSNANAFDRKGFSPTAPFSVFSTFSADSLNQNKVALDMNFEFTNDPQIQRTNLNISYGLTNNVEVSLNLPYNLVYHNSINTSGAEDLNFGIKHRFIEETTFTPAVAYLLFVSGDFGSKDFSTEGGIGGGLIVTKKVGPVRAHGNLLYFRPEKYGMKETWNINLGSELNVSYNSTLLFEIIGRKAIDKGKIDLIEWRLGYRVKVNDFSYTTVGAGFDIRNRTPDLRLMFGITFVLPKEKQRYKKIVDTND
ncbi:MULTISPECIES: hypothetical protein [Thermodesulfovibrio]|jgi:hypothetical protein|uniref:hypothetical protein n=1 Tax=Thermodesulfovibrio TaxID=28261 RepID=UPI00262A8D6E|nr:hypothetical protein [Thermodesulfovibrio sp.]